MTLFIVYFALMSNKFNLTGFQLNSKRGIKIFLFPKKAYICVPFYGQMGHKQFNIQFGKLGAGSHRYEFEVENSFFEHFEHSELNRADIKVTLDLLKQNGILKLQFHIKGTVGVECDRCLGEYDIPLEVKETLIVKNGNPEESSDEMLVLSVGETELNIAQTLYEYIILALPGRKVPCEINESYICDAETLAKLKSISKIEKIKEKNSQWEKLNKIKFNN
jgi:uncharacterized protein